MLRVLSVLTLLASTSLWSVASELRTGNLTKGVFRQSQAFPGTHRDYAVYIPANYDSGSPANLIVFMDGMNYARTSGPYRATSVLDELIADGSLPPTIAVFVNPGTIAATKPDSADRRNRSFEYDSMSDRYSSFLVDEFLPAILANLNVTDDPSRRAVAGASSGGICAFTAAWHRPDQFGNVLSHIGSFTNIRGGWAYPGLIRQTKDSPKPIKVYLQDGRDDLNNMHGNWPLANQDMAAALQFAGYTYRLEMTDGGHNGKAAGLALPDALKWLFDDKAPSTVLPPRQTKPGWKLHPDAAMQTGVPHGTVTSMPAFESTIFPGTTRAWAVYVPAQYDASEPAALMVIQDGERLRDIQGKWRIPNVMDNLIARGDMPPTIGVFIDPGHHVDRPRVGKKSSNRSREYDSLGDHYVRFLVDEILPLVESKYNISKDPAMRAIGGSSSGAICAFTAAWQRPDVFGKVYNSVGSYTNLRGGDAYPGLVRKTEPKPIRVYMADTSGDVDNAFGSWPIANQRMASALDYMGYDVRLDWAEGYSHGPDFGSPRFAEAMTWLWREEVPKPTINTSDDLRGDQTLLRILITDEPWRVAADGLGFADAPCSDENGHVYFCDMRASSVFRIDASDASVTPVAEASVSGMMMGPDGRLYGCSGKAGHVISINPATGELQTVATGVTPNDLVVTDDGFAFITETRSSQVTRIHLGTGETHVVDTGIVRPNGIALSPDGGTLAVSASGDRVSWTFRVNAGGELDAKMPTMPMRMPIDPDGEFQFNSPPPYLAASRGDGMTVDRAGRYYVTSAVGVQVFDSTGRPCGVIAHPSPGSPLTSCTIGGPNHDELFVTCGKTVYRRRLSVGP